MAPAATSITLTPATVAGSVALNSVIGALAAVGGVAGATFTYTLPSNPGNLFNVSGANLRTNVAPVIAAGAKPITVRATDNSGRVFDQNLTVTVT
jgi:hypothetical protein